MVVHKPGRPVPGIRFEKTHKYIPGEPSAPQIRIFHSTSLGPTEYNDIWSHKCGRDP